MKIVSFLIAFVIFSIVILFHELGHFLLAKANGIRVNEFCFGLGPTICGIQKGETKYCIKAFPFGGACMMEGEDEDSTYAPVPHPAEDETEGHVRIHDML